jgi:hypothetical protein
MVGESHINQLRNKSLEMFIGYLKVLETIGLATGSLTQGIGTSQGTVTGEHQFPCGSVTTWKRYTANIDSFSFSF